MAHVLSAASEGPLGFWLFEWCDMTTFSQISLQISCQLAVYHLFETSFVLSLLLHLLQSLKMQAASFMLLIASKHCRLATDSAGV